MSQRQQLERILEIDRQVRGWRYPNADTLARDLKVSRRVIYNDRQFLLERLKAPLACDRRRGGWYYTTMAWKLPAVLVTRGEMLAFFLSVEVARRHLGTALEDELRSAVRKIEQSLPDAVTVDLESLRRHFSFAPAASATTDERTLLALQEAIEACQRVRMTYYTASRDRRSQRIVEPYHLHDLQGDWYLFAFDHRRGQFLTFHVGRIEQLETLPVTFARDPRFNAEEFVRSAFQAESGREVVEVAVRFDAQEAPYIRERRWHETQTLEEQSDGSVLLRLRASGTGTLQRWLLQYGSHAEVLSPPSLREAVAEEARRTKELYERKEESHE